MRRAARKLEAFLVPRLLALWIGVDKGPCLGHHVIGGRGQFINNAGLKRRFGVYLFAFHQEREGRFQTDHTGQALSAASSRQQSKGDFRKAQLNLVFVQNNPVMARQADFQTTTEGRAIDGCHDGFAAGFEDAHLGFHAVDHVFKGTGVLPGYFVQLFQVTAGKEGFLGGGDNNAADIVEIAFNLAHCLRQCRSKIGVHGVGGLAGHVDGQGQDLV